MFPTEPSSILGILEAIVETLDQPIIVHDPEVVVYANAAARTMLRAPDRAAIEGVPFRRFVHEDGRQAGEERRRALFEHGVPIPCVHVKLKACDGATVYCCGTAERIIVEGRPYVVTKVCDEDYSYE